MKSKLIRCDAYALTVNFQSQRLRRHLAADYTMIMPRTLKVMGNHVTCHRGARVLKPGSHLRHNDITERSRKPKKYLMLNVLCF